MAKLTIGFGVLLAIIAVVGHSLYGATLHPAIFGLVLVVCGFLAMSESPKQRMIWMHVAVTIGLLGALIPGSMSVRSLAVAHSTGVMPISPGRVHEQLLVAVVCLVFVALCVRSFIAARRARLV